MLHVRGGFFTNYAADLTCPAWLYLVFRGLHGGPRGVFGSTLGRTPESAALSLFAASTLTEMSQRYWPHGVFSGRFDPFDILAYGVGLALCYAAERLLPPRTDARTAVAQDS